MQLLFRGTVSAPWWINATWGTEGISIRKERGMRKNDPERVSKIIEILNKEYPRARTALRFTNPLELLVATVLSAQCTDERVN